MLEVKNLKVGVEGKEILSNLSLMVRDNEVCALMGQNGSGKSTLAQTIMGNPAYAVENGSISLDGGNVLELSPSDRSLKGLFLSFQNPYEIDGVSALSYLRLIYNKRHTQKMSPIAFRKYVLEKMEILGMDEKYLMRYLNCGFSGGEKKRMEMLQMLVLQPKLAILDEVDSGLDVDALKTVAAGVTHLVKEQGMAVLLITHYARILEHIIPDNVFVMKEGTIAKTGGKDLANEIEEKGYAGI